MPMGRHRPATQEPRLSEAIEPCANGHDSTSASSSRPHERGNGFANRRFAQTAAPWNNEGIQRRRVFESLLRCKDQARFGYKRSARQPDRDYFVASTGTVLPPLNLCISERIGRPGQINCHDAVKSYEANSLHSHAGTSLTDYAVRYLNPI